MSDAMTNGLDGPASHWASLLDGLVGARRDAVISALRHSARSGWPPSAQAVRTLVDYAQGLITAQEYAVQILVDLGMADSAAVPESVGDVAAAPPAVPTDDPLAGYDYRPAAAPLDPGPLRPAPAVAAAPPPAVAEPRITREEAVQAYVSGRIPVEEFLRIARGA